MGVGLLQRSALSAWSSFAFGAPTKPEDSAALAALDGTLYYVGGRKVLAIDPRTGKVTVAARLPVAVSNATATTVGNEIVIAGGGTNGIWALKP